MALELRRLIKKVSHMDITLIAGEDGLHNLVSWVHMVETTEASDFLEGGEIIFTTGLGLNNSTTMLKLVQFIHHRKASGMIVNIGPFIETIPQEVIDFCNRNDFPLFIVPWKIHLAEIMRIFCFTITKEDQKSLETAAAFKNAIFFPNQEELYVVPLSQHGFHVNWKYSICLIKVDHIAGEIPNRIDKITLDLQNYARHNYKNFALFCYDSEILLVAANYTESELKDFVLDIKNHTKNLLLPNETLTMGCGKLTKSVRCLYKSYEQAKSIQKLQERNKINTSFLFYSDMGIYKLLMGIEDKEIIKEYCDNSIRPLLEFDRKNNSDLSMVLRCYLKHNGSVKETADELYVHRNTINYKLGKVGELLEMDLSSLSSRLLISVGFMLQDLM